MSDKETVMDFAELTAEEQQPFIDKVDDFLAKNDLFICTRALEA